MDYLVRFIAGRPCRFTVYRSGRCAASRKVRRFVRRRPLGVLATLSLALAKEGSSYVSLEGRSMVLGAMALALYSSRWYEYLLRFALGGLTSVIGGLAAFAIAGSGCWPAPMVSYRSCSLSWLGTLR
jgi:hypothetical protein